MIPSLLRRLFFQDFVATTKRFYAPLICAFLFMLLSVWYQPVFFYSLSAINLLVILACSTFALITLKLLFEREEWSEWLYGLVSLVFVGTFTYLILYNENSPYQAPPLIVGLFLSLYSAPFIFHAPESDKALYRFAYSTSVAGIFASLATFILCLGVTLTFLTLRFLFALDLGMDLFMNIWIVGACFVAPFFALAHIPRNFENSDLTLIPKKIEDLVRVIIVPLTLIYLTILYIYFIKIWYEGELPRGILSYMVIGISVVGLKAYWISAYASSSKGILNIYQKIFFPLLLLPLGMLFWALYIRIEQYGITLWRYQAYLVAVWILGVTLYGLVRQRSSLRGSLLSLTSLLILSSFGPWSAYNVSVHSQTQRLETFLIQKGMLREGKIHAPKASLNSEDQKTLASLLFTLGQYNHLKVLNKWLGKELTFDKTENKIAKMFTELHVPYTAPFTSKSSSYFALSQEETTLLDSQGFNYVGLYSWHSSFKNPPIKYTFGKEEEIIFTLNASKGRLSITLNQNSPLSIELNLIVSEFQKNPLKEHIYTYKIGSSLLKLRIKSIHGNRTEKAFSIDHLSFIFCLK